MLLPFGKGFIWPTPFSVIINLKIEATTVSARLKSDPIDKENISAIKRTTNVI